MAPEAAGQPLNPDAERRIEELWRWGQAIRLVEIHAGLAARARALLRHALTNGWERNARDALHLASAQQASAATVHTYDKNWYRYADLVGKRIERPNLLYVSQAAP